MSSTSLFRSESEAARHDAWLGRIVLIRPLSFTFLTACALAIAAGIAAFFLEAEYTRKARVSGVLAPAQGVVRILAPQAGLVERVFAAEGEEVPADAPLLTLGDERRAGGERAVAAVFAARLDERERALRRERDETLAAARAEAVSLRERRSGLGRELDELDAQISTQSTRTALSKRGATRAERLAAIGFLSGAGLDREHDAALEQAARGEELRRSRAALEQQLATLASDLAAAGARARAQAAALDRQLAALAQERIEHQLLYRAAIHAPARGTVATVLVEPGQAVVAGTPLVTLLPAGSRLEAHLFAPSRAIGFVRPGQAVLVRYLAYPYQKFGLQRASVAAVSRNPMLPAELGFTPTDGTREPVYRIKAALESQSVLAYGHPEPLQPGMQVEADILLDRRRLIEWVFEPLLSLAGRA